MASELTQFAKRRASPWCMVSTPCSLGELIDKITILRIKTERIGETAANVGRELNLLERLARTARADRQSIS